MVNCVAFYVEPETRQSRFIVQGEVDREEIAKAAQSLIELLDTIDGDPDLEDDDPGGDASNEDEPHQHFTDYGPGCPIADPGGCEHDGREPDYDAEPDGAP